ncbi:hydroxymethylpyrimidine/phosphomethylpyrimidine kinase [Chryseobacterium gossypii]|uniref:hydroxymethylpyrimidine/phosphomethylpyrimidine kinase n=1 Tax=Chryseobacterium gossypii TaxID=3231602 RepID=UPI003523FFE5
MQNERPFVMTVAGYDPSGGAGLLADIKTMEQLEVMGLGVCTAMTLQTESRFLNLEWRPLDEILRTIEVLMESYPVKAVKIGIVKDASMLAGILNTIRSCDPLVKVVWDPVLKSTSDFVFFDMETLPFLRELLKKIDLITPNYPEYKILKENGLFPEQEDLAPVLVKGGHREDRPGTDILMEKGNTVSLEIREDFVYYSKHGSGCVLSSAIAGWLSKGNTLEEACRNGKLYIEKFLKSNPSLLGFHSNQ